MELSETASGEAGVDGSEDPTVGVPRSTPRQLPARAEDLARDLALVRAAREGEGRSMARLADRLACVPRLLSRLNARRGGRLSAHDVEDLAQDTLLGIWKKLGSYHGQATFEGWLWRFCFLEFMNRVRLQSRRPEAAAGHPTGLADRADGDPDLEREELELALGALGRPDAEVVRLKHFEQLTFEDIGGVLGITSKMAKTRYYRGIARLERELGSRRRKEQG